MLTLVNVSFAKDGLTSHARTHIHTYTEHLENNCRALFFIISSAAGFIKLAERLEIPIPLLLYFRDFYSMSVVIELYRLEEAFQLKKSLQANKATPSPHI